MSEEEDLSLSWDEARGEMQRFLAAGGEPAFVVRGKRVEEARQRLVQTCYQQRKEWLGMVRLRLGTLYALAGEWGVLRSFLAEEKDLRDLQRLHEELKPELRLPVNKTESRKVLHRALRDLCDSLVFFNTRWQKYLQQLDLSAINQLREKFNKYYLIEKECVVGSPALARRGFQPLAPLTTQDLLVLIPTLPVPHLVG